MNNAQNGLVVANTVDLFVSVNPASKGEENDGDEHCDGGDSEAQNPAESVLNVGHDRDAQEASSADAKVPALEEQALDVVGLGVGVVVVFAGRQFVVLVELICSEGLQG